MKKLMALIDGSVYSRSVCDHAAWVSRRTGAEVELFHVLGRRDVAGAPADFSGNLDADARDTLLAELAELDEQKSRFAQRRGRLILEDARKRLEEDGVREAASKLRHGDVVETVQEFEGQADLIVIGKRGEAADFATLHLGSNLERVVRASQKPVLVAARTFQPIGRVLVAFDGGPSALKAVNYMAESDLFKGLHCTLLTVGSETDDHRRQLEDAAHQLRAAGLETNHAIVPGQADSVIADKVASDKIDLVVMGAYGHSRIRNLIIGSTTTEMIRSCKVPILLFR